MMPLFILSQELTYVPDDNFETYLETYFPACDNGIDNDDYVLTSGLYGGGENPYECINLTPQTLDAPIFDLTGIEDFQGGIKGMRIEQQLIQNLNLAMFKFMPGSTAGCNYVLYGTSDLFISQCTLLEEILLPSDTIALSISGCPLLDNVYFPEDISLYSVAITGVNMCELKIRGQGLIYSQAYPFIISLGGIGLSATN
ncbi:MAG: hypothetical protein CMP65_04120, partial [Flavobacteriales bacterium]|nr:hypothetical protein [Flavobacteriales bacterium]